MLVLVCLHDGVLWNDEEVAGDHLRLLVHRAVGVRVEGLILRVSQLVDHLLRSGPLVMRGLLLTRGVIVAAEELQVALGHSSCRCRSASFGGFAALMMVMVAEEVGVLLDEHGVIAALLQHQVAVLLRCGLRRRVRQSALSIAARVGVEDLRLLLAVVLHLHRGRPRMMVEHARLLVSALSYSHGLPLIVD